MGGDEAYQLQGAPIQQQKMDIVDTLTGMNDKIAKFSGDIENRL